MTTSQDMNALRWKNGATEADKKRLKEISKLGVEARRKNKLLRTPPSEENK